MFSTVPEPRGARSSSAPPVEDLSAAPPSGSSSRQLRFALAATLVIFVCRVAVADGLIPPWQGPDEPAHFALAKRLASGMEAGEVEPAVLASMARHEWWRFYQRATPEPLPVAFSQVPEHLTAGTLDQPAYYVVAAAVLKATGTEDIDSAYRVLRWLSVGLTIAALICGWAGTRALWGEWAAMGTLAIVSLHPQFLLSAISVNPDALITLCGAFMWWQAGRALSAQGWERVQSVALLIAASIVAVLSKRNGVPLVVIAILFLALVLPDRQDARTRLAWIGAAVLALALVPIGYMAAGKFQSLRQLATFWSDGLVIRQSYADLTVHGVTAFLITAVDMSWLFAGWLRFPAPAPWLWVARGLTAAGVVAAVLLLVKEGRRDRPLALSFLFVAVHAGVLLSIAFWGRSAPQGRYLFASLFPAAAILWVSVQHWAPPARRWVVGAALVGVVACLDAAGFLLVLLPAYSV
jgi:hypothetical protein